MVPLFYQRGYFFRRKLLSQKSTFPKRHLNQPLLTLILLCFCIGKAYAEEIYDIEILPAKTGSEAYHLSCARKDNPCTITIPAGSSAHPRQIDIEAYAGKKNIALYFYHAGKPLSPNPIYTDHILLEPDQPDPVIADLYQPSMPNDSPFYAVGRPSGKFFASLRLSLRRSVKP